MMKSTRFLLALSTSVFGIMAHFLYLVGVKDPGDMLIGSLVYSPILIGSLFVTLTLLPKYVKEFKETINKN